MENHDIFYFDHAAATPVDQRVIDAMMPYFKDEFYNPSSPYAPAVRVRRDYEAAKARIAQTFGAKADEIIITAGATESINLAINSFDGHIVTYALEHDAVLAAVKDREHTLVKPDAKGMVHPDTVYAAITDKTSVVSIQVANNELGTIQPLRDISQIIKNVRDNRRKRGITPNLYLHCDASQGFGHIDIHTSRLGVDLLTLNAAKIYGPKQVGLLWAKPDVPLKSLIVGGGQERGLRSGTQNVAGVIGFAVAADYAHKHQKQEMKRLSELRDKMQMKLQNAFPHMTVSGNQKKRLPGSLHVSFPGLDGERLVFGLEASGVLVATGSACAANKGTRSHVLSAIGMSDEEADGSIRISLGRTNDENSINEGAQRIIKVVSKEYARLGI